MLCPPAAFTLCTLPQVYRVLKPGAIFVSYEWVSTSIFDKSAKEQVAIIDEIIIGNGLPVRLIFFIGGGGGGQCVREHVCMRLGEWVACSFRSCWLRVGACLGLQPIGPLPAGPSPSATPRELQPIGACPAAPLAGDAHLEGGRGGWQGGWLQSAAQPRPSHWAKGLSVALVRRWGVEGG
jgi:hypothetical protein